MHKIYSLLISAFLLHSSASFAHSLADSIGVENYKGKKVILYKVEAKETYYSIARKYNVPYNTVMAFNDNQLLQPGAILKIPTQVAFTADATKTNTTLSGTTREAAPLSEGTGSMYTVKPKDNLNLIANNFGTTVEAIKQANGLQSINLQIGQVLRIPVSAEKSAVLDAAGETNMGNAATPPRESPQKPIVRHYTAKITHKVKSGETLGGIALKYDTSVEALKKWNKLSSSNLKIGQALKVEVKRTETIYPKKTPETNTITKSEEQVAKQVSPVNPNSVNEIASHGEIIHTVVAGETIYAIARKYNLTTYQIQTANNLSGSDLKEGQKLIIKGASASPVANNNANGVNGGNETGNTEDIETMVDPKLRQPASRFGLTRFDEKGKAMSIEDPDLDSTKMLVLHRTAPVGTIIRITNPLTNRSAFAKVVGKFTENENTKDVIIVITKAVADAVGALDKQFFCNINYGAVENEQQ